VATARKPLVIEVGLIQLAIGSPAAMPGGTRSAAREPPTVPRKKGVSTDEKAKAPPNRRCCHSSWLTFLKAKADPRAMMPKATSVRGI